MNLKEIPVNSLLRTSGVTFKKLKNLEINNFWDLTNYFPYRFENYALISTVAQVQPGETATLIGKITSFKNQFTKNGFKIQKAVLEDTTGTIELVWYNQMYLYRLIKPGIFLSVAGTTKISGKKMVLEPAEYEILKTLNDKTIHTGRLVPVYSVTSGLSPKTLREKIYQVVSGYADKVEEFLPQKIIDYNRLIPEAQAYNDIHFPVSWEKESSAKERLSFDELFLIQLNSHLQKQKWQKEKTTQGFVLSEKNQPQLDLFIKQLPFTLTNSQKKCWQEISTDLQKNVAMNRFLQGDVGSGKTVVAALACYLAYLNNHKSLIMAPTEILAKQHFSSLQKLFQNTTVKIGLQTGSVKIKNKEDFDIIVGTQALISEKFSLKKLGLIVIDEQHRFGVNQRAVLKEKGNNPHLLTMTATPIPRTVALTLYGELEMSVIDEMPVGRLPVKTYFVPKIKRQAAYAWIKNQIKTTGTQVFIVCPLIEESEIETMKSVKAVQKEYADLQKIIFPELKIGLLHGKMKPQEKDEVMADFKNKKIDILLCTPVVEVGVDIPNANIMVIEAGERFGLAQLHQLRGRVGRDKMQAYCYIFTEIEVPEVIARLHFFAKTNSGIDLAEYDMHKRGAGEIYGTKQHGFADLKVASLTDLGLIEKTKNAVNFLINNCPDFEKIQQLKERLKEYNRDLISRD